jgi:DNA gyrase/topoisomerase IV subunit B
MYFTNTAEIKTFIKIQYLNVGVVGRDYYGVFPLKGKLLNVREALHAQIMKNEEIQNIAKILG